MSGGFHVQPAALEDLAGGLRDGSEALESSTSPPPAPEVGACTAPVAAVLGLLTESAAGVVEGVGAAGDAVADSAALYAATDSAETGSFGG